MSILLLRDFAHLTIFPYTYDICCFVAPVVISLFHRYILGAALVRRWVKCDLRKKRKGLDLCTLKKRRPRVCRWCGRCQNHAEAFRYWSTATQGPFSDSGWYAGDALGVCVSTGYLVLFVYLHVNFCVFVSYRTWASLGCYAQNLIYVWEMEACLKRGQQFIVRIIEILRA